ncbi:MAG: hypothetical protein H0T78_08870 [Longispora sp.]|nr:hypothetical protein [Longispora sp. (in: high G+C Gram-positive bacteria)]
MSDAMIRRSLPFTPAETEELEAAHTPGTPEYEAIVTLTGHSARNLTAAARALIDLGRQAVREQIAIASYREEAADLDGQAVRSETRRRTIAKIAADEAKAA